VIKFNEKSRNWKKKKIRLGLKDIWVLVYNINIEKLMILKNYGN